jgi:hypothetical protein
MQRKRTGLSYLLTLALGIGVGVVLAVEAFSGADSAGAAGCLGTLPNWVIFWIFSVDRFDFLRVPVRSPWNIQLRVKVLWAIFSGGALSTSLPLLDARKTACRDRGMRVLLPFMVR